MGAKTKEVGGGPAVGLANDWTKFLQQGLQTGTFGGTGSTTQPTQQPFQLGGTDLTGLFGGGGMKQGTTGPDALYRSNPVGSTQGIAGVINSMLNGGTNQKYGVDTSALLGQLQTPTDFSGFQVNLPGQANLPNILNDPRFNQLVSQAMSGATGGGSGIPAYNPVNFDLGNPDLSPYTAFLDREKQKNVGDLRARFTAGGGLAYGSPAAIAESNLRAETDARNAAGLADIGRQEKGLELSRLMGQENINTDRLAAIAAAGAGSGATAAGMMGQGLDALLRAYGLSGDQTLGVRGQDIQAGLGAGGLNLEALMGGANNRLQTGGLNIDAISKALGLDLQGQQLGLQGQGQQADFASNIMQLIQQLSGKGIADRQIIQTPGFAQQALGTVTGLAGAAAPFFAPGIGDLFKNMGGGGGGGGTIPMPTFNLPTSFNMPSPNLTSLGPRFTMPVVR